MSLLTRESLKEICGPGSGPGVGFTAQVLFSLSRHCLIRYDLGIPLDNIVSSCTKESPTANLSIRNSTDSTFALSLSDKLSYCFHLHGGDVVGHAGCGCCLGLAPGVECWFSGSSKELGSPFSFWLIGVEATGIRAVNVDGVTGVALRTGELWVTVGVLLLLGEEFAAWWVGVAGGVGNWAIEFTSL